MGRRATGSFSYQGTPPQWHVRVTGRDQNGKKVRPWVGLGRPDLKDTPEDRAIAEEVGKEYVEAAKTRVFVGRGHTSLANNIGSLVDRWGELLDRNPNLSDSTRDTHKSVMRVHIVPHLEARTIGDLAVPILRQWIRTVACATSVKTGKSISAGHLIHIAATLTLLIDDARAEGWCPPGPNLMNDDDVRRELWAHVRAKLASNPNDDPPTFWTPVIIEKLLLSLLAPLPQSSNLNPAIWFGMILVSLLTGLRAGELHGFTFAHIRARSRQGDDGVPNLRVRQQAIRVTGKSIQITPKLKTLPSKREIPLHAAALEWLVWWEAEGWELWVGRKPQESDLVFCNDAGQPWRPEAADDIRMLLINAGLPSEFITSEGRSIPFEWKTTRSTFAHLLDDAGIEGEVADALLGHGPKTMRGRHYAKPSLERKSKAIATLAFTVPNWRVANVVSSSPSDAPNRVTQSSAQSSSSSVVAVERATIGEQNQTVIPSDRRPSPITHVVIDGGERPMVNYAAKHEENPINPLPFEPARRVSSAPTPTQRQVSRTILDDTFSFVTSPEEHDTDAEQELVRALQRTNSAKRFDPTAAGTIANALAAYRIGRMATAESLRFTVTLAAPRERYRAAQRPNRIVTSYLRAARCGGPLANDGAGRLDVTQRVGPSWLAEWPVSSPKRLDELDLVMNAGISAYMRCCSTTRAIEFAG